MADNNNSQRGRGFRKRPASSFHSQRRPTPSKRPANNSSNNNNAASPAMAAPFSTTAPLADDAFAADSLFMNLTTSNIHPDILKSVTKAKGLTSMTPVQAETLPVTLARLDVLAQARTGTGKTLAFLLPAIQRLLDTRPMVQAPALGPALAPRQPSLLVISPTRELALQIAAEAQALLDGLDYPNESSKPSPYKIVSAIGGTNANTGLRRIKQGCDIIVATPGRILDYLGDKTAQAVVSGVQTLVLDEADRLLDMGFIKDIKKMLALLPPANVHDRQSMLFSATMEKNVHNMASLILKKNYQVINTVAEGEPSTHERVSQRLITVGDFADLVPATVGAIVKDLQWSRDPKSYKAIVFLPTTAHVDLYAEFMEAVALDCKLPEILAIHSRKTQGKRTDISNKFRASRGGILVATDVIARGLDFPNVTHVYQTGLPSDKASYIHRLGRTGRAGAEGDGALLLTCDESKFAKTDLREIDFKDTPPHFTSKWHLARPSMEKIDVLARQKIYRALLGAYKGQLKTLGWTPAQLVQNFNRFALQGLYLSELPTIEKSTASKMGLKGVPGLNIAPRVVDPEAPPRRQQARKNQDPPRDS